MWSDIIELREFYASPRGRMVAAQLSHALAPYLTQSGTLAAYGYAPPVLPNGADKALLLMPAPQGVAPWPSAEANQAVLCEEVVWPLADQSVDTLLLVHALENCASPPALLAECWRVLKGNGRLVLLAANRRGLWSRTEATPFGRGRPFTATQLRRLLYDAQFVPEGWQRALYTPPFKSPWLLKTAPLWEKIGPRIAKIHGGVVVMGAAKQLYAPTAKPQGLRQLIPALPQMLPSGMPTGMTGATRSHDG